MGKKEGPDSRKPLDQLEVSGNLPSSFKTPVMPPPRQMIKPSEMSVKTFKVLKNDGPAHSSRVPAAKDTEGAKSKISLKTSLQKPLVTQGRDSPKKQTTPTLNLLNFREVRPKQVIVASEEVKKGAQVSVEKVAADDSMEEQRDETVEEVTSPLHKDALSKEAGVASVSSIFTSPRQDDSASISLFASPSKENDQAASSFFVSPFQDKKKPGSTFFGSSEDSSFSPGGGEDFFSKTGNDFLFGGENEHVEDNDGDDFFSSFGGGSTEGNGNFSLFGDESQTEDGNDFFSFGEDEKEDGADKGFCLF